MTKRRKGKDRKGGRHVQLGEWLQRTEAWGSLKPGPRALYIEIKRRFNGSNNGEIILSHRDAAKAVNVHRNTVGTYFDELVERGFIVMTEEPYLGPSGIGLASVWGLTEEALSGKPATKDFIRWKEDSKTPHKNSLRRYKKCDGTAEISLQLDASVTNNVTYLAKFVD